MSTATEAGTLAIPSFLHEVFGERSRPGDLVIILLAALTGAVTVAFHLELGELSWWRAVLALALVADIAGGTVANLTPGTSRFYAARPGLRWGFIAVHVHVPVLAWLVHAPMGDAVRVWALTVLGAVVVNLARGHPLQRPVGGLVLAAGAAVVPLLAAGTTTPLIGVYFLFLLKVAYSFAVDHHARVAAHPKAASGESPGPAPA